ncbi:hypothetical protein RRG08_022703 [Elysia crispata]|uniref:Uncharacterized protein n=1 Tax=Elysia crispata TaxID=231223 RepID=A0AAE1DFM1_9GAST|nr:hypothetical protein RRG08_022703 [Elysia crispata]
MGICPLLYLKSRVKILELAMEPLIARSSVVQVDEVLVVTVCWCSDQQSLSKVVLKVVLLNSCENVMLQQPDQRKVWIIPNPCLFTAYRSD